jgi:hypothetical protein
MTIFPEGNIGENRNSKRIKIIKMMRGKYVKYYFI